ncbi:hypothetical protein [Variovorax rhizosphaerae]|uniref:Uncharacterized protein n=1 Tax=Variovorax rhizosphaerae TaxID=1836200 RepID=A0ABU8WWZ5_9BURK
MKAETASLFGEIVCSLSRIEVNFGMVSLGGVKAHRTSWSTSLASATGQEAQRCSTSPMIRDWVRLYDRVQRAEKVSSPTQWSPLEVVAYEHEGWALFSRLRGYTTREIADFKAYLALCESIKRSEPDGEVFLLQASLEIQRLVSTEAFRQVEARLLAMSHAQRGAISVSMHSVGAWPDFS